MILADLVGLVIGGILAQHFRALILIPSSFIAVGGVMAVAFIGAQDEAKTLLAAVTIAVALQIGYFFGLFSRRLIADQHKAQMNTAWRR